MKTKELNALNEEGEILKKKLAELTKEEQEQVNGCAWGPDWGEAIMRCSACGYTELWHKDPHEKVYNCPKCFAKGTFRKEK